MSPAQVRHLKIILSSVFTTALNDFVVVLHPCRGVKTPTVPVKEYRIVTPVEFEALLGAMPSDTARLLVEVALGSGLRWGELIELRPADLHMPSGIVTITRAVVEVNPKYHPDGERFLVKPYPKNKRSRRFKLDPDLVAAISTHSGAHGLAPSDLLFRFDTFLGPAAGARLLIPAERLGRTEPNAAGRQYAHGSLSAYTAGKCRCVHCRAASPTTAPNAGPAVWIPHANHGCATATGTCRGTGSPTRSGYLPVPRLASTLDRAFTTCVTRMRRGYWPAEPIFRSLRSDLATAASRRPASTCTPYRPQTRPPSPRSAASVKARSRPPHCQSVLSIFLDVCRQAKAYCIRVLSMPRILANDLERGRRLPLWLPEILVYYLAYAGSRNRAAPGHLGYVSCRISLLHRERFVSTVGPHPGEQLRTCTDQGRPWDHGSPAAVGRTTVDHARDAADSCRV